MRVCLIEIRNVDYQDGHFYLVNVKTRNARLFTLGKFKERDMLFEYFNYYTNSIETVDIFEQKKLLGVYSIENLLRDVEYSRFFES